MKTEPPLTRLNLDFVRCMMRNCPTPHPHPLILHAVCHPHAHLDCEYFDGLLHFRCCRCLQPVCTIAVAEGKRPS